ncbi:MAG: hypothetical protein WAU38_05205 [Ignavibacteria bacterium]
MKKLYIIFYCLIPSFIYAQANVSWIQDTRGVSLAVDNSNNVYTIDYEYNPAGDIYLTKRDLNGNFLWVRNFDQTDNTKWEKATWVSTDNSGNIIVTGNLMSGYSNPVIAASIIMKFNPAGDLIWRNVYENSFDGSYTKKCLVDIDNNIYVLGAGVSTTYGFTTKVTKFSPSGTNIWTYYNGSGIGVPLNFKFSLDNKIVIAARSVYGSVNGYAKLDLNGNPIWSIAGVNSVSVGDAAGDASGNTYITFSGNGTAIRKVDPSGNQIWQNNYNITAQRIEVGSDNIPVAAGFPYPGSFGSAFVKVDPNGNQVWLNSDADGAYNLMLHAQLRMDIYNNIYLAAGTMTEMAICKVNSNGTSAWTLTMPGSYATGFDIGTGNSVFVTGGTTAKISQTVQNVSLNLTGLPEGLWNQTTMSPDTVSICLRNQTSPYSIVGEARVKLSSNGSGILEFSNTPGGSYYIAVTHRNSIETWSKDPVSFITGTIKNYDFTSGADKAFGNNMLLKQGKYVFYGGDVERDGIVDALDISIVENAASVSLSGYVVEDLTGDNFVDVEDLSLVDNNTYFTVSSILP